MDKRVMLFIVRHENLIMAIAIACLAIWGGIAGHPAFIFGLALVGATAYFAGILIATGISLLYLALDLYFGFVHPLLASVIILQLIGYLSVAYLGYKHKTLREEQKVAKKPSQVLPWAVVNEVRTSLSAIRFLLFPLQDSHSSSEELQKATNELSRLEKLFHELEHKNNNNHHE